MASVTYSCTQNSWDTCTMQWSDKAVTCPDVRGVVEIYLHFIVQLWRPVPFCFQAQRSQELLSG